MFAKAIKRRCVRGALEYEFSKETGDGIGTNMSGSTPRALVEESGEIHKRQPMLGSIW